MTESTATPLRIVFAGTPDFAARHLDVLLNKPQQLNAEIVGVYTQPDRPAGRGKKLTASPVKQLALEHGIEVYQPENFKLDETKQALKDLNADVMIVVAYGLLLPEDVLSIPRLGCLNVHGSILPRWRGAAPIQRAIWAGDQETGVTIMQMDVGLDTGDMLTIARHPIDATDTSASLYEKLANLGPNALVDCLVDLVAGKITPQKQQDALANYAKKLSKEEAKINWSDDAEHIERCIRAFNPWPVSYFSVQEKSDDNDQVQNIKVWQARVEPQDQMFDAGEIIRADKTGIYVATGTNILVLESIQIPGKKALPVQDVLNSKKDWFNVGQVLA